MLARLTFLGIEMLVMLVVVALNMWSDRRQRVREEYEAAEEKRRREDEKRRQDAVVKECLQDICADVENLKRLKADVEARMWAVRNKRPDAMVN